MNHHLRKELERRVKASEYSMKGLSKAVGHGETLVRDIITGRTKNPSQHIIEELARKLDCSIIDLYGYDPSQEEEAEKANDNQEESKVESAVVEQIAAARQDDQTLSKAASASSTASPASTTYSVVTKKPAEKSDKTESRSNIYKPADPFKPSTFSSVSPQSSSESWVNKYAAPIAFLLVILGSYLIILGYEPSYDTFVAQGRTHPGEGPKFDPHFTSVGIGVLFAAMIIYQGRTKK